MGGEILLNAKYTEAHPHCSANILPKSNERVKCYERNSNAFPCYQCHSSGFVWFCQPGWMSVTDFSRYGDSMAILLNRGLIMSIDYAQGSASYRFVLVIISVTFVVWFIDQSTPVWFTSLGGIEWLTPCQWLPLEIYRENLGSKSWQAQWNVNRFHKYCVYCMFAQQMCSFLLQQVVVD